MSLNVIEGLMGGGKSYFAVNRLMVDFLRDSNRPIVTNLPLELESFLVYMTRNAAKQAAYRERIVFLERGKKELPAAVWDGFHETGNSAEIAAGRERDTYTEFWWFAPPNSVIILDETADLWNARDFNNRPESMQTYINHHRHYKQDLFFFCQNRDDLDVQIRRKIQYVWQIRNSKYENMFDGFWLQGVRWPLEFFFCRQYQASEIWKKQQSKSGMMCQPLESRKLFPTQRGFKNYRSFSAAETLKGMELAADDATSTDFEPNKFKRMAKQIAGLGAPAFLALALLTAVVGGYFGLKQITKKADEIGNRKKRITGDTVSPTQDLGSTTNTFPGGMVLRNGETPGIGEERASGSGESPGSGHGASLARERVVFASPVFLETTRDRYTKGANLGRFVLHRILLDGVELLGANGIERVTFEQFVSLCGKRESSGDTGGSDLQPLRDIDSNGARGGKSDDIGEAIRSGSSSDLGSNGLLARDDVQERSNGAGLDVWGQ